jgi:hypothetical protein
MFNVCSRIVFFTCVFRCAQISSAREFTTLRLSTPNVLFSDIIVENKKVRVQFDFNKNEVELYAQACAALDKSSRHALSTYEVAHVTFDDDSFASPVRLNTYKLQARENCGNLLESETQTADAAHAVFGLRTSSSPFWRVWTYASITPTAINVGRTHPKNAYYIRRSQSTSSSTEEERLHTFECEGGKEENFCIIENVQVSGINADRTFQIDFVAVGDFVRVPRDVFDAYTSREHCGALTERSIDAWPPLVFAVQQRTTFRAPGALDEAPQRDEARFIKLSARQLIGNDVEASLVPPDTADEWCEYATALLRASPHFRVMESSQGGQLDARNEGTRKIEIGVQVLTRTATLHRDVLAQTLTFSARVGMDHFGTLELIIACLLYCMLLKRKIENAHELSAYTLARYPRCPLCHRAMAHSCQENVLPHANLLRFAAHAILIALAWYSLARASHFNSRGDEGLLLTWLYCIAIVGTVQLAIYFFVHSSFARSSLCAVKSSSEERRAAAEKAAYNAQSWFFVRISGADSLTFAALISVSSVVREDNLDSSLHVLIAFLYFFDVFYRLNAECTALAYKFTCAPRRYLKPTRFIVFLVDTVLSRFGLQLSFAAYVLYNHVLWPALLNRTFIFALAAICIHGAVLLVNVGLSNYMSTLVKNMKPQAK